MIENSKKVPKFIHDLNIFSQAIRQWGIDAQLNQTQEECAELITSISHWKRGRNKDKDVVEEMVDVQIMLNQLLTYFGSLEFDELYEEKIKRLEKRLNESK